MSGLPGYEINQAYFDELIERGTPQPCHDPWVIVRTKAGQEHVAAESLRRDGFEVFYPVGRRIERMPLRFVAPKKRRARQRVLREDVRLPFPAYLFVRRLFSLTPLSRLYGMAGVVGACAFGDTLAQVSDIQVEKLRIAMDAGDFDEWDASLSARDYQLAEIVASPLAKKLWNGMRRVWRCVDEKARPVHLIEEFGRITRILAPTDIIDPLPNTCLVPESRVTLSAKL